MPRLANAWGREMERISRFFQASTAPGIQTVCIIVDSPTRNILSCLCKQGDEAGQSTIISIQHAVMRLLGHVTGG